MPTAFLAHFRRWKAARPLHAHWLQNVLIGIAIELLLHFAHGFHLHWLTAAENAALDMMTRAAAGASVRSGAVPLAFIDIDAATWRNPAWGGGEPYRAPRHGLLALIDFALRDGAAQVVVDVAIEGKADDAEDRAFAERIDERIAAPDFGPNRRLVFVRTLREPLPGSGQAIEIRASALDRVIVASQGRVGIAAPYFLLSHDLILRDWMLWRVACNAGDPRHWVALPSVQLRVLANRRGWALDGAPWAAAGNAPCERAEGAAETDRAASGWLAQALGEPSLLKASGTGASEGLVNRIVYRIDDPPQLGAVRVVSALHVLEDRVPGVQPAAPGRPGTLQGAIAIIGQSHTDAHDRHATPLGDMAGSLVLLNSIDSLLHHGVLNEPSPWIKWPFTFALIAAFAYVFARWSATPATTAAVALTLAALVPLSYQLFKFGVWLDFALPLIGIWLHRLVKRYEETHDGHAQHDPHTPHH